MRASKPFSKVCDCKKFPCAFQGVMEAQLLKSCEIIILDIPKLQRHHTSIKKGPQVKWHLRMWKGLDSQSATVRKSTLLVSTEGSVSLCLGAKQQFSSFSPNYSISRLATAHHTRSWYTTAVVSGCMCGNPAITSDTFSRRSDKWWDWSLPTRWQIQWQKGAASPRCLGLAPDTRLRRSEARVLQCFFTLGTRTRRGNCVSK